MYRYVFIGSAVLAGASGSAVASGFCDGPTTTGGGCEQNRASHLGNSVSDSGGAASEAVVVPDFSDLYFSDYPSLPSRDLSFRLNTSRLGLEQARGRAWLSVLELGLARAPQGASAHNTAFGRVLSMSIEPGNHLEYKLVFDWLDVSSIWSIANPQASPVRSLGSLSVNLSRNEQNPRVRINHDERWTWIEVSVYAHDAENVVQQRSAVFEWPAVPDAPGNIPLRLRSGVIGGTLQRTGMETSYFFEFTLDENQDASQ